MWAIYKRELKAYFYSPLAYVLTGIYTLALSLNFLLPIYGVVGPVRTLFGVVVYSFSMLLALILPILTMKVFADEKKNGTEVLLMTSPNSVPSIVMGKYLAAFTVYMLMIAVTGMYPIIIAITGKLNVASMLTSYIGYILMGAFFVAFGVFTSSLTENSIVSAVLGSLGLFLVWIVHNFLDVLTGRALNVAKWISFFERFRKFIYGIIGLRDFIFFFSLIGVFLALTMIVVEKKRWSQG
ncbi:MAG: ABC transporter permease subunit [Clostridiaceae bacterium]|jgi:ABC-2 type transport system permease protein|nr:ABC transporter permease subunit [Clostridiaceae bacterium]